MTTTTPEQQRAELAGFMFNDTLAGITYWAQLHAVGDAYVIFSELEEEGPPQRVTLGQFVDAITTWATRAKAADPDAYRAHFARDWLAGNYDAADYDAEVADQIFQTAAFGSITYG